MNLLLPKTLLKFLFLSVLFLFSFTAASQTYTQITTIGGLVDGEYLIVGDGTNDGMMINTTDATPYINYSAVTNPGATITTGYTAANAFQIVVTAGVITIYNSSVGYASWGRTGNVGNTATFFNGTVANTEKWTATVASGLWTLSNVGTAARLLQWNAASPRFACYTSAQTKLKLYIKSTSNPTVSTTTATSITVNAASSGGNVTADGGAAVSARGVVYGTAPTPTLSNSVVTTGSGTGSYTSSLTGLAVNTRYYYRAYATNTVGTAYGNESNFYTLANVPGALVIGTPGSTTIPVSFNSGTENSNPGITTYAIQETGGLYVQANGSLGAGAVWQTAAAWATVTVTGLANNTTYTFQTKARNGDLTETAFGTTASGLTTGPIAPVVSNGSPSGTYNVAFTYTIIATNAPTSYALLSGAFPPGLSLNTSTGEISGTPTAAGSYSADVTATNAAGSGTGTLSFTIATANQSITFASTDSKVYGTADYAPSATSATSGVNAITYSSDTPGVATIVSNQVHIVGFGTAVITASQAASANYNATSANQTLTVTKKALTITGLTANNKVQDGNTTASLSGTPSLSGVVGSDDVSVTGTPTAAFASATPATGIAVTVTGYSLTGSASANYTVSQPTGLTANITALDVPTATAASGILYNGLTANWNAVTGAASYLLDVYKITQSQQSGEVFHNTGLIAAAGWTETNVAQGSASNDYLQLLTATSTEITPTVDFSVLSNASFKFKARTFGGPTTAQATITVSISINNGSSWTTLATRIPTSTTLTDMAVFDLSAYTSNQVKIRIQTLGAGSSKGVGIDDIILTADQLVNTTTYVLQNQNVGNVTSYAVSGLTPVTTYYYKVRSVNGSITSGFSNEVSAATIEAPAIWNGTAWSNVTGPTATVDAFIEGVYNTENSGSFIAKKLTLTSGSFTINSGDNITVVGQVINNMTAADFVIESNANLLQQGTTNTNTGNVTVKRNSAAIKRLDYTLWSAPVTGQGLYAFSPLTFANRFYTYNSSNNQYVAFSGFNISGLDADSVNGTDNNNAQFSTGTGYLIRAPWNHPTSPSIWTGTFRGVPNNGDVTVSGLTSGLFYATGNPYPSTIDADQFIADNNIGDNALTPGDGLYFWRKTNNASASSYATYTTAGGVKSGGDTLNIVPNGVIQVGEGFIVKATSTSLGFNNNQRIANNDDQFLRTANIERNRIWLNLSDSATIINQMMVAYMTGATQGIDAAIDGRYLNDSPTALNSLLNNEEFTIQGRSMPFNASDIVPLAFKATTPGSFSIAIDHADGLFTDGTQAVYLKDNLTGTEHNLQTGAYSFASDAGSFNNRFEIIYQSQLVVENPAFTAANVIIFNQGNDFVINSGNAMMSSIKVFDIRGRLIQEKTAVNANQATISGGLSNGVLLVQITSEDGMVVTKKVIR